VVLICACSAVHAQDALTYQKPPAPIQALLDAPTTPVAQLSPDRTTLLIAQPATYPTIAEVAPPRFGLAGIRFNPQTNGPSREIYTVHVSLETVDGSERPITGLPPNLKATHVVWSPDSHHIAFGQRTDAASAVEVGLRRSTYEPTEQSGASRGGGRGGKGTAGGELNLCRALSDGRPCRNSFGGRMP